MIYNTQRKLINALRDFEQVSKPYETIKPRAPKKNLLAPTRRWIERSMFYFPKSSPT